MGIQTTATQNSEQFKTQTVKKEEPKKSQNPEKSDEMVIEINPSLIIGIIIGVVLLIGVVFIFTRPGTIKAPETFEESLVDVTVSMADGYTKGLDEAKIKIIEYSDYECPYCKYFATAINPQTSQTTGIAIVKQIESEFVDTKKIQYIYKPYSAVPSHSPAFVNEAVGAQCAAGQNKFWEFHEATFTSTRTNGLGIDGKGSDEGALANIAELVGINRQSFIDCYKKRDMSIINKTNDSVNSSIKPAFDKTGQTIGTPLFVICVANENNQCVGKAFTGALPIDNFRQVISILDPTIVQTTQPAPSK